MVIGGYTPGGQLTTTTTVENFPGFPDGIEGPELMARFQQQAEKYGAEIVYEEANEVDLGGEVKVVKTSADKEYKARAVVIATGATPRRLDIPGEDEFYGRGVSTCATCDGALYKDKVVAVIGGGDSAMEESTYLTKHASKVYLIHRRDEFRASKIMAERALANEKIEVMYNTEVIEVVGADNKVDHLRLKNTESGEESELKVDGMFLAIGHIPVSGYVNGVAKNELGYVLSEDGVHTNIEGVYVAGDVQDAVYRQAVTAAGYGAKAAIAAQRWLDEK